MSDSTDHNNGAFFAERSGGDFHHVPGYGWLRWRGTHYERNDDKALERMAELGQELQQEAATTEDQHESDALFKRGTKLRSLTSANAALRFAATHSDLVRQPWQLDADPMLLNVENGVIDLRTGELREHRREDLMTKRVPVVWDEDARHGRWSAFLREVLPEPEVQKFASLFAGYSLTGLTREEVFALLHGSGANGKSVFLRALRAIAGDYAVSVPEAAIVTRYRASGGEPERLLAVLPGARIATTTEIGLGRLREEVVKMLVSGEALIARRLYQEGFEFEPKAKLWLSTNVLPDVSGSDDGIWRRVRVIDFPVTFPPDERDRTLADALHKELPGILVWAVAGAMDWHRNGLDTPKSVLLSTDKYRLEQNPVAEFVDDACLLDHEAVTATADLYAEYKQWAVNNERRPVANNSFGRYLGALPHGLSKDPSRTVRQWRGIRLRGGRAS